MSEAATNTPEFTVSEIAGAVKRALEGSFSRVRVRGEITEFKAYASGHQYFALKDDSAKIRAIIWKGVVPRAGIKAENGIEVIATGRITSYPERSEYQLIIEKLEYAGAGALLARIEILKARLQEEGLFQRKRPVPLLPQVVGVITSPQGAVLQDIKTTIFRRFPRLILLWPVPVQGDGAAEKIAAAIDGFNSLPANFPQPDVIIVARGGGSLEDLMAFNEEAVVRAVAGSHIPLISAVGHETDTTLIDFAADCRAPTPTAAAEIAVPARVELVADLSQRIARLDGALARHTTQAAATIERNALKLPDLPAILWTARQRFDDRGERLLLALPNFTSGRRLKLGRLNLRNPLDILAELNGKIKLLSHRLTMAGPHFLFKTQKRLDMATRYFLQPTGDIKKYSTNLFLVSHRLATSLPARQKEALILLDALGARLDSVSYERILGRGFALVTTPRGTAVTSAAAIAPGASLRLRFADGRIEVRAAGPKIDQLDLGL
ncbi:MAG: exodeoxyribonuclease VII large subunit [Rhodospirillales bacterium]|nr:exodeoxyribonuclease VII large subunit [Rhodospirillales bacterium]